MSMCYLSRKRDRHLHIIGANSVSEEKSPVFGVNWASVFRALMRGRSADGLGLFYWRTFNLHGLGRAALFRDWLDPDGTSDFRRFIDRVNYPDICQSFIA